MTGNVSGKAPYIKIQSSNSLSMVDICFFVLLGLLALEMRPLESCVIATIFNWEFMFRVFNRWVRFSLCAVFAYSSMIQGQLYLLFHG